MKNFVKKTKKLHKSNMIPPYIQKDATFVLNVR